MIFKDGSVTTCHDLECLAMETSGQGMIECAYGKLLALFGTPHAGDEEKVQAEWMVYTPAGIATIYDWKQGDCYHGKGNGIPVEEVTEWSIGGNNYEVVEWIQKAIKTAL